MKFLKIGSNRIFAPVLHIVPLAENSGFAGIPHTFLIASPSYRITNSNRKVVAKKLKPLKKPFKPQTPQITECIHFPLKMTPKPKLKAKTKEGYITRNDAVPGYVYIFRQTGEYLVKIGLSRTPAVRKRYLEKDYGRLQTVAIVWVFNMSFVESKMHKFYAPHRTYREYWKSGYTEWFKVDFWKVLEMRVCLYLLSFFMNAAIVITIIVAITLILFLLFR